MNQKMITDLPSREWIIVIDLNRITDYVNAHSTVTFKKTDVTNENILTEVDNDFVLSAIMGGVANISTILTRRMEEPAKVDPSTMTITYKMIVGDNHDDSMANVIYLKIMDYLCNYAVCKWNQWDVDTLKHILDDIRSAIHYRKRSVSNHRRFNGIF